MTKDEVLARLSERGCSASDAQAERISKLLVSAEEIYVAFFESESATVIASGRRLVTVYLPEYGTPRSSTFLG